MLVNEINAYDEKTKEQEAQLDDKVLEEGVVSVKRIKDYKKTSLLKPISVFEQFLRGLDKAQREKINDNSGRFLSRELEEFAEMLFFCFQKGRWSFSV